MTTFVEARAFLLRHRTDYDAARFQEKIRRVQLRRLEHDDDRGDALRGVEFCEEDFPELQALKSKTAET